MNVNAGLGVVDQIPSRMIGIVIDDYVVGAGPAPIRRIFPVAWKNFKAEAAVKPEAMEAQVKAREAIRMRRAEIAEAAMLERMVHVEARIVSIVVTIPVIIADMRPFVYFATLIGVAFRCAALSPGWRRRRNATAVPAMLLLAAALPIRAYSHKKNQSEKGPDELFHMFLR